MTAQFQTELDRLMYMIAEAHYNSGPDPRATRYNFKMVGSFHRAQNRNPYLIRLESQVKSELPIESWIRPLELTESQSEMLNANSPELIKLAQVWREAVEVHVEGQPEPLVEAAGAWIQLFLKSLGYC